MPRYFKTANASRPYKAGGLAFDFEPLELTGGGSWLGVLVVDEPAASILAGAAFPQVTELSASDYEALKKKIEEGRQQLRAPSVSAAPQPAANCHSCGSNGYKVRNR